MFGRFQEVGRKILARTFGVILLGYLMMYPSPGEARGFSKELLCQSFSLQLQTFSQPPILKISERASTSMVGTIMTFLATFEEAGVLPPEGTAQANQVIHALIQVQSAFMKSPSSELAAFREAAIAHWGSQHKGQGNGAVGENGLTDRMLAALITYDLEHPLWQDPKIVSAMQKFNVTKTDWMLIVGLFKNAEGVFRTQGRSLHSVYEAWRLKMPGGKS